MSPELPPDIALGPVHLTVTDLDRSIGYYQEAIGLQLARRENGAAVMSAGDGDLLVLVEAPDARPAGRHAGLYHFALLHPSRLELARAAQRLLVTRTPITGASDHGVSEAIYLSDPDGNGIELYADRPPERWGDLRDPTAMAPDPLDMNDLLDTVEGQPTRPRSDPGLRVGHLHLHVGDIERALAFYRDVLGFEVTTGFPSAAFIAAGGYHHHLGLNTWRGEGVPPAPPEAVGLRRWTIELPDPDRLAEVRERLDAAGIPYEERDGGVLTRDPWDNALLLTVAGGGAQPDR